MNLVTKIKQITTKLEIKIKTKKEDTMLRTNSLKRLSAGALIAISLSACQNAQNAPKQTMGNLMGAGVGALLGAQMGGGKG